MPSIYAHYTFGEMMKQNFPSDIKKRIDLHKVLFEIGLHGPDLFFYYYAPLKNRVSQTGYRMHDVSAAPFFRRAKDVILSGSTVPEKNAGLAYILGFLCHFTLDSVCHSYIEKKLTTDPVTHSDIETNFDRYLLLKQHRRPLHAKVTSHLRTSQESAKVIRTFFPTLSVRQVESSISSMIWYNDLFTTSDRLIRSLVKAALHATFTYKSLGGLLMNETDNPLCTDSNLRLDKLMEASVPLCLSLTSNYLGFLHKGIPLSPYFRHTFGPKPGWREIPVLSPKEESSYQPDREELSQ